MGVLEPLGQALGVILLAAVGAAFGKWAAGRSWWPAACGGAIALLATFALVRWIPSLQLLPVVGWVTHGRWEFALFAPVVLVALLPLARRLPHDRQRSMMNGFLFLVIAQHAVLPFLMPAVVRTRLGALKTMIDQDGVCRQTTRYTCGPAASVTALRKLGIAAEEADLAVRMYTSPTLGTPSDVVALTLQDRYGDRGLRCDYRSFASVDALPRSTPVLAVVRYGLLVDHFVTVLDVNDTHVIVGDPILGKVAYSRAGFAERWRFMGIVLTRDNQAAPPSQLALR